MQSRSLACLYDVSFCIQSGLEQKKGKQTALEIGLLN